MRKFFVPQEENSGARFRSLLTATSGGGEVRAPKLPKLRAGRNGGTPLALTEVRGNLTFTASEVTAWYTAEEQVWPFKPDAQREQTILAAAGQYAALAGMQISVRRTSIPFPIRRWAADLDANAQPLPDLGNIPAPRPGVYADQAYEQVIPAYQGWHDHVNAAANRLQEGNFTISRTQIGVTVPRPGQPMRFGKKTIDPEEGMLRQFGEIGEMLWAGMKARPSTSDELVWLIYRSTGIGLTPPSFFPGDVGPEDIAEFTENVDWQRSPFSTTTQLTDRRTGRSVHVAVLTVGRMETLEIPQTQLPWAHVSEMAGFPVEWSSRVTILAPEAARGSIERRLLIIRGQQKDYAEHDLPAPPSLERRAKLATIIGDQMDTGLPVDSTRAHGWHRLAVFADTEQECLARVRELSRRYADELHITLVHPRNQPGLLREFIPGEPAADTGHLRRMPVTTLAAAMPQATARVGDHRGDLIGYIANSAARPVLFDPHFPMEVRERSGLIVVAAEPGGGKSTLLGALAYLNVRRGVRTTVLDPSGPLANLCRMPELAPYSRVVNLTGSQPGTLAPYAMIPTPQRTGFARGHDGDIAYDNAVETARAERRMLALDVMQMLLPPQIAAADDVIVALYEAVQEVEPEETAVLDQVVANLTAMAGHGDPGAKKIHQVFAGIASYPLARLFFGRPPAGILDTDAAFTVITFGGLSLPDAGSHRETWPVAERTAVPMLHVASRLAVRRSYEGDRHQRKLVGLDEAHIMSGWPSGRAFLDRLARDSRKYNIAAAVASQNPSDILKLDVQNLVTSVFIGRIAEDAEVAAEALRLLRLPVGEGYENILAGLSQYSTSSTDRLGHREFVVRDVDNRVQKVVIDVSHVAGLLAALNTTPGVQ